MKSNLVLTNLPVDCLEPIVSLLSAYDIGNMWLTGNGRLQFLLSEGGAVKKFDFSHRTTFPLLWPRLIQSFPHLMDLSIRVDASDRSNIEFEADMSILPFNLRVLKFHFAGDFTAFMKSFDADPIRYSRLRVLHLNGEILYGSVPAPNLSSFKELTDVSISSSIQYARPSLQGLVMPPNVTELDIPLEDVDVSTFPSTLTRLTLVASESLMLWPFLPHGLLHLSVSIPSVFGVSDSTFDVQYLPPHLISLSVNLHRLTPEITLKLPRSLKHLRFTHIMERIQDYKAILPCLPASLETLEGLHFLHSPDMNLLLPRGLSGSVTLAHLENLPVNITTLIKPDGPLELLRHFTRLNRLELDSSDDSPSYCELGKYLSPTLKTLKVWNSIPIQDLPPHLTSLYLPGSIAGNEWKLLPRELTSLELFAYPTPMDWEIDYLREMPPKITLLHLDGLGTAPTLFLEHLPLSLVDLKFNLRGDDVTLGLHTWSVPLSKLVNLRTLFIKTPGIRMNNARVVIQNLPRRLTDLTLKTLSSDLNNADLQHRLPPGLTSLAIDQSPNITFPSIVTTPPATLGLPPYLVKFRSNLGFPIDDSSIQKRNG